MDAKIIVYVSIKTRTLIEISRHTEYIAKGIFDIECLVSLVKSIIENVHIQYANRVVDIVDEYTPIKPTLVIIECNDRCAIDTINQEFSKLNYPGIEFRIKLKDIDEEIDW